MSAATPDAPASPDIVVTGQRVAGSAIGEAAPVAVLDERAIRSVGATSLKELLDRLKPLTASAGGGDPVILLNGRRMSGFGDLQSLPPEAMERTEVLPETEAARFGFPPTVKVLNFITKKRFRGTTVQLLPGTTTEGGGETHFGRVNAARIDGPRRLSLSVSHLRLNPVVQGERAIVPDPDDSGSAASAPYRSLQQRSDRFGVDGTIASPIGKSVDASLNLSMEAQRNRGLNGLAPQAGGLYRYDPDALLRQRTTTMNLHAGGIVQGGIRRWGWSVTSAYDRVRATAAFDQPAFDRAALNPVPAGLRTRYRTATVTDTVVTKAVANGPLFAMPAGDAQVTLSLDHARSTSRDATERTANGVGVAPLDLQRTTRGGSINAALPITAPGEGALGFMGRLGANAMVGVSDVSAYGRLASSSYGLNWAPARAVQLTAVASDSRTPPAIALLTDPLVSTPNTPFFDFTTGGTVLVTALTGGNLALLPERRRITQLGAAVTPIRGKEFRLGVDYIDTRIDNQTSTLGSATPAFQSAFPLAFRRDDAGQLVTVDLRPVTIARERERKVRMTVNLSTQIGRAPPRPPGAAATDPSAPPPKPPKPRPSINASVVTTVRLADRLTLATGSPSLDLLDGATLNGTGGRPRWESEVDLRGSMGAANIGLYGRIQGPTRSRGDSPASDLRFSGRVWLVPYASFDVAQIVGRPWARGLSMQLTVENLLNDRINVRDRNGATPNRFQAAYLDPLGRSVRIGVRKQF